MFVYLFPNLRNCQLEPDGKLVPSPPSPNVQTSVKLCDIAELYLRSFSTNLPQTWPFYYFLGSLFRTKNEKSKDYCKADSEQLVLFFRKKYFGWPYQPSSGLDVTELMQESQLYYIDGEFRNKNCLKGRGEAILFSVMSTSFH